MWGTCVRCESFRPAMQYESNESGDGFVQREILPRWQRLSRRAHFDSNSKTPHVTPLHKIATAIAEHRRNLTTSDSDSVGHSSRSPTYVVLVSTGSYNPVHRMHVGMFDAARAHIERVYSGSPGGVVVGGFLSPSHHEWVAAKFGDDGPVASTEDRIAMCEAAVALSPLLSVSTWECTRPFAEYASFADVVDHVWVSLRGAFPSESFAVFYVCGADHALNCRLHDQSVLDVVCVGRPGFTDRLVPFVAPSGDGSPLVAATRLCECGQNSAVDRKKAEPTRALTTTASATTTTSTTSTTALCGDAVSETNEDCGKLCGGMVCAARCVVASPYRKSQQHQQHQKQQPQQEQLTCPSCLGGLASGSFAIVSPLALSSQTGAGDDVSSTIVRHLLRTGSGGVHVLTGETVAAFAAKVAPYGCPPAASPT